MRKYLFAFRQALCFAGLFLLFILLFSTRTYAQAPVITSLSQNTGFVGASVTINGSGFNASPANNLVFFGATKANISTANTTSISVTVPAGATCQYVSVTNLSNGLTAYSPQPFTPGFNCGGPINTSSFAAKIDSVTAAGPYSIVIGDFDGDGKSDIAIPTNSSAISLYRNTSTGSAISFAPKTDFSVGQNAFNATVGDFDGDGKLDIAVVNFSYTLSILRNISTGTISFAPKTDFATGSTPYDVTARDFDGDGRLDIAIVTAGNVVSIFKNTGTGAGNISMGNKVDFTTGTGPVRLAAGDLDGDGKADLAVANSSSNTVSLLRNTSISGTINFATKIDSATGSSPSGVAIIDIDGDGKLDIAVSNRNSASFSIFRNQSSSGTISLAPKMNFATGNSPETISVSDIDGDGKADLIVSNTGSSSVSVFKNVSSSGTISLNAKVDFPTGSYPSAAIGDLEGDGKPEIVTANNSSNTFSLLKNIVAPIPITSSNTAICIGSSAPVTASGANTYTWAPATGLSNTTGATVTANPSSSTTYTITGTSVSGCTTSTTVAVTVNPLPNVTAANSTICMGSSTPITATGANTYTWSPASGLSATTGATVMANPTTTTTYTVTGTSVTGCSKSTTVSVTVNPLPNVTVTNATICIGSSAPLTASGASTYTWSPASGLSATTGANVTANPTATTTYTVTGTSATGCSKSITASVTVNPLPTVTVANATICIGSSTSLTASGANTYTWSPGGGLSATTGTTVTANPSTTTTYAVTGTSVSGCSNSTSVTVTVNANPSASISGTTTICNGSSTTLTASGGSTYSWNTGQITAAITVSPSSNTSYTVTVTNGSGCTAMATQSVTVNASPNAGISGATIICDGSGTTLTAFGGSTYSWSTGETTTSITVSPSVNTTYSVSATSAGCTGVTSTVVTVNPLPVPTISGTTVICLGSNTTLTANGGSTYNWSTGETTTSITVSPSANTSYSVTATSAGCAGTTSVTITVNTNPTPTISGGSTICSGSNATLTASGGGTYSWNTGETTTSITVSPSTTTSYTVTATTAGCNGIATTQVTVMTSPTLTTSSTNASCGASNGSASVTASGGTPGYTYNWSPAGGVAATAPNLLAGNYVITVTDANACTTSASVTVNNSTAPTVGISGTTNVSCKGGTTGSATVSVSGGAPPYTYSWNNGVTSTSATASGLAAGTYICSVTDANSCVQGQSITITEPATTLTASTSVVNATCGNSNGSASVTASGGTPGYTYNWSPGGATTITASGLMAGTYTVIVTDANGCTVGPMAAVTNISGPGAAGISSQTNVLCNGATTGSLTVTASGGTLPYTYSWDNGVTSTTATASGLSAGTYMCTITDANGCIQNKNGTITQPATALTANATSNPSTICSGGSASLSCGAAGGTGAYTYNWIPGAALSSTNVCNPIATPTVNDSYTLTVTDANGCSATTAASITVNANPTPGITGTTSICNGSTTTLTASGGVTYQWSTGASSTSITVSPVANASYTVTATNASGCTAEATATVTVNSIPSANAGADKTICFSAKDTLNGQVTGGTAPYTYLWNSGATTYSTQSVTVSPSTTTAYTLTVTDINGCSASDYKNVTITPSTDIYGHVNYSGGNLTNGNVILYKYLSQQTHFDTVQTSPLNASGDYAFTAIPYGSYLVEVFANATAYPNAVPTYYGDQSLWNALPSEIVYHDCNSSNTLNITLIEIPVLTGPGKISGNVTKGPGFGNSPKHKMPLYGTERTDPIPGIDVKLGKKPGGSANIVGQTETDANGDYSFVSLPLNDPGESYVVFVDIPGLGRDSCYVVVLDNNNPTAPNLDYIADSTTIYIDTIGITTGLNKPAKTINTKLTVYPNPSDGMATVEYTITHDAVVSLGVYNMLGMKVYEMVDGNQSAGTYRYTINTGKNNLKPGIYFVTLVKDGKTTIQRMVITE